MRHLTDQQFEDREANSDLLLAIPYDSLRESILFKICLDLAYIFPAKRFSRMVEKAYIDTVLYRMNSAAQCQAFNFRWLVKRRDA